jgi:hypothetical protein
METLVALFLVAGVQWQVYLGPETGAANRVVTADVRFDEDCKAKAEAVLGSRVPRYARARFPAQRTASAPIAQPGQPTPASAVKLVLPQRLKRTARCLEVMDWKNVDVEACALRPATCALWGNAEALPVRFGTVPRCVRAKPDAGLACLRNVPLPPPPMGDGGVQVLDLGRTVTPRAWAVNPATCEPVNCVIYAGEDPEVDL